MEMIGHKRPGITGGLRFCQYAAEAFQKISAVLRIDKNFASSDTASHNMLKRSGGIDARHSWHTQPVARGAEIIKLIS